MPAARLGVVAPIGAVTEASVADVGKLASYEHIDHELFSIYSDLLKSKYYDFGYWRLEIGLFILSYLPSGESIKPW